MPTRTRGARGRAGTDVGSAVHAVLQDADLESGEGIAELAGIQATAHMVSDRARRGGESGEGGARIGRGQGSREVRPVLERDAGRSGCGGW